jgi:hypothetical protein
MTKPLPRYTIPIVLVLSMMSIGEAGEVGEVDENGLLCRGWMMVTVDDPRLWVMVVMVNDPVEDDDGWW